MAGPRYVGARTYELLDAEVGRLVRLMPRFETSFLLVASSVRPDRTWLDLSLLRTSDLVQILEDALDSFPEEDRSNVERNLAHAREVLELRNLIVHGRWTLVDPDRELYEVEKILTRAAARRALGRDTWSQDQHPALVMPMNAATVARAWRLAGNVANYLGKSLDRWEQHFGSHHRHSAEDGT